MMFLSGLICLLITYAAVQVLFYRKRRSLLKQSWGDLVSAIKPVNIEGIAEIGDCYLHPSKTQLSVEPDLMWSIVGGLNGLRILNNNAKAMLDLAVYAEQWNPVEGRIVSEMMRRDGVRLKRSIRQVEFAVVRQAAVKYAAFELQEAVASYYLMRGRLLGLYEVAHAGRYKLLAAAV